MATELIDVALETGETERAVEGLESRFYYSLNLGDLSGAESALHAMARLTEELRQPAQEWLTRVCRALLLLLLGKFAEADRLIHEALDLGEQAQGWNARVSYRFQLYLLRKAQGRLGELEEVFESLGRDLEQRAYPVFDCLLARFFDELGRESEARAFFESFAADDFTRLPFDDEWLVGMTFLAETATSRGDAGRAEVLYELLLPYADLVAVSYPEISTGSVSRYLGLLASTMSRVDDAARHFEDAVAMNERIGARPWLAHTREDYARLLLERARSGDGQRAAELFTQAIDVYRELGMNGYADDASAAASQ